MALMFSIMAAQIGLLDHVRTGSTAAVSACL
jgi:hypothetical protein